MPNETSTEAVIQASVGSQGLAFALVCRIGAARLCALPLHHVLETMRPQPLEALAGALPHVLGVALVRGVAQPVVDLARLLDESAAGTAIARWVALRVGERRVALAVAEVLDVRPMPVEALQPLPPLLSSAGRATVAALAALDAELVLVLDSARLLPDMLPPQALPP